MPASQDPRSRVPEELRDLDEVESATAAPTRASRSGRKPTGQQLGIAQNPSWYVPLMCALLVFGVIWVSTFYITQGAYPIGRIGYWNIAIGLGALLGGFALATNWK